MNRRTPIETVEDFIFSQEWSFRRVAPDEIIAGVKGRWCDYHLHFIWNEQDMILQFFILLSDIEMPASKQNEVYTLMGVINEKLKVGHFELFTPIKTPAFRHSLLISGTRTLSENLLEALMEIAFESCEKFYPAFQFVIFGNRSPQEAVSLTGIDSVGEA